MLPYSRRFVKEFVPGYGTWYIWGIVFLALTIGTTLCIPLLIREGVAILEQGDPLLGISVAAQDSLVRTGMLIVAAGVVLAIFRSLSRILIFIPGRRIEAALRQRVFDAVATIPPGGTTGFTAGDLISRGSSDVTSIRVTLSMTILHSINTIVMAIGCVAIMLHLSPLLTLICLFPAPLLQVFVKRLSKRMMERFRAVTTERGELTEIIRESFAAHMLVSIYPVYEHIFAVFQRANDHFQHSNEYLVRLRVWMTTVITSLASMAQLLLLIVGSRLIMSEESSFGIKDFVAFSAYLMMIQDPLLSSGWLISTFQRGEAAVERLYAVFDRGRDIEATQATRKVQTMQQIAQTGSARESLIEIRDLAYHYPSASPDTAPVTNGSFQLDIPSLKIETGRRYGIFGPVGCGKSTLINILAGNIPAPGATCFYRGIDYQEIRSDVLLRHFSMAPQESRHFARTIRRNIDQVLHNESWSDPSSKSATDTRFNKAYLASQLDADVPDFPEGLDSMLGEQGINLSGGQRQRLSILRALVKPHTVLVLDDIVSSVDHHTESEILRHLFADMPSDRSLIFASHRVSALIPCHEIWIMQHGRIEMQGSHEQLLEQHEIYRRTYEHQVLEQAIEA
ncbi:MAG: ABC transporter ATP-binding protein [Verrucomicrobia bacterium]|nr:ABC transporter ATP-binding protein [Verrucomicrobiota bacterium]MDA1086304.1 ABC transporter ATP-binding protein [Verrucomicrobiota bacterium]